MNYTYVQELEHLILDTLLPSYVKQQKSKGSTNPYQGMNEDLLKQIQKKKKLPALFRPKESLT